MIDDRLQALTVRYRVRFDECSPAGTLRAAVYLRCAQDVAWIHSERLGYDLTGTGTRRAGSAGSSGASSSGFPRRYRLEYLAPVAPATPLVATAWADGHNVAECLSDEADAEHLRARLEWGSIGRPLPTAADVTDPIR